MKLKNKNIITKAGSGEAAEPRGDLSAGSGEAAEPQGDLKAGFREAAEPQGDLKAGFRESAEPQGDLSAGSGEAAEPQKTTSPESGAAWQRSKAAGCSPEGAGEGAARAQQAARLRRLLRGISQAAVLGLIYYLWLTLTGIFIPCPVRLLTGWLCPGCGVTHCCLALAHLDFEAAFEANAFIFCLLPAAVPYGIYSAVRYVRRGGRELSRGEILVFIFLTIAAVVFTVCRNC